MKTKESVKIGRTSKIDHAESVAAMEQKQAPHIAILPSPGMGHLIPLVGFANRIVRLHGFSATIIIPTDGRLSRAQKTILESLPPGVNSLLLPPVSFDDLTADVKAETRISLTIARSLPYLREALQSLVAGRRLAALVVDLFCTDAFDVASEFGVSSYVFFTSTAMGLSLLLQLPRLDEEVSGEYRDMAEPVRLPGCVPIQGKDMLEPAQDRKNDAYKWILHHGKRYKMAEGIMVNTFMDLEPGAIKALQQELAGNPPLYPVGPLTIADINGSDDKDEKLECIKWLDEQPAASVLYISFGSGGTLLHDQILELAAGLEISGHRFLWVIRCPDNKSADANFFAIAESNDPLSFLPYGFLERTGGRGLMVPFWAPQPRILSHASTGGFLTHCGWNSTLESVINGVPLIAWPLYAEQRMNAVMLTQETGVALGVKRDENGLVGRDEVTNVVKGLMEGEEGKRVRNRMREMKEAARMVLGENGESTKALDQLACKWKTKTWS